VYRKYHLKLKLLLRLWQNLRPMDTTLTESKRELYKSLLKIFKKVNYVYTLVEIDIKTAIKLFF
jgi:hypothetical protein